MQRITKKEVLVIAAALAVLALGFALELALVDGSNAFQRSGSVLVCVGIGFGVRHLNSFYVDQYEDLVRRLDERRLENDIMFSDEELDVGVRGSTNDLISRARSIRESGEKRVVLIDTAVLVLGTVIWGFGDLVI